MNEQAGDTSPTSGRPRQSGSISEAIANIPSTACFNCRALRQRCNRCVPCDRCVANGQSCRFPSRSNRGRKQGSTNKPETAEKLLARIRDSPAHDEVVAALLQTPSHRQAQTPGPQFTTPQSPAQAISEDSHQLASSLDHHFVDSENDSDGQICGDLAQRQNGQVPFVSPLHIVAAAVSADQLPHTSSTCSDASVTALNQMQKFTPRCLDVKVAKYFSRSPSYNRDWHVLAAQSVGDTLKLEPGTCDPVTAQLIGQDDVSHYFKLFFAIRNPLVGILDPTLHTTDYVFEMSFTLFSTICALGCAISTRPKDGLLYPALKSIAEADMKWSIAMSIKTIEIIQAILIMQYWGPVSERQLEDPYWMHLNHATHLSRELGLSRPQCISKHVKNLSEGHDEKHKLRLLRNFERTWIYVFIADKGFGIITGRSHRLQWTDLPNDAGSWWRKSQTEPSDRMVSGLAAMRVALSEAKEASGRCDKSAASIAAWHEQAFENLTRIREESTTTNKPSYIIPLRILAFYHDHGILVLNAQALENLLAIGTSAQAPEIVEVSRKTIMTGCRFLDTILSDKILNDLKFGFHNNMFIMVCHAVTEILQAIKRGGQAKSDVDNAVVKIRAIPQHLGAIARGLPASSHAHLYSSLSKIFAGQTLETSTEPTNSDPATDSLLSQDAAPEDWFSWGEVGYIAPDAWLDMGFLTSLHQQDLGWAGIDNTDHTQL
ncbi:hypothetical protein FSHL1_002821 [Fusarium sambucinum]